jgi:hypothetical protein
VPAANTGAKEQVRPAHAAPLGRRAVKIARPDAELIRMTLGAAPSGDRPDRTSPFGGEGGTVGMRRVPAIARGWRRSAFPPIRGRL